MDTLIIYDDSGTIYFQGSGDIKDPIGLQHMKITIPQGYIVQKIDMTENTHTPVLIELPKSSVEIEIESLKRQLSEAELDNLTTLEALAEVYEMMLAMQA